MLLSLFCGAGGLDLGFEEAGYKIGLAFDIRNDSIASYNHNRPLDSKVGRCADIRELTLSKLDQMYGVEFRPQGIIGGPPCQSFSRANKSVKVDDPRHQLPFVYADLIDKLNKRSPVDFFMFENVPGIDEGTNRTLFSKLIKKLEDAGFVVKQVLLNALEFGVPQNRSRVIMIGLNKNTRKNHIWLPPKKTDLPKARLTVGSTISHLPEPTFFTRNLLPAEIPFHPNHWCMQPKSLKFFTPGRLTPSQNNSRSFKTLSFDQPSITVAYGNREVHVHPHGKRRLSVLEAMLLQGFPENWQLLGSMSSQFTQVSEAVPPPMSKAIALSIGRALSKHDKAKPNSYTASPTLAISSAG